MKLAVGTIVLGSDRVDYQTVKLSHVHGLVGRFNLSEISRPKLGKLAPYLSEIDEVVLGFVDFNLSNVDFLQYLPNVTNVWILESKIANIDGLRRNVSRV